MPSHSQLPPNDRAARSRLIQFLAAARPLTRAGLVTMARVCGKKGCRCARGEKRVSLYLAAEILRGVLLLPRNGAARLQPRPP